MQISEEDLDIIMELEEEYYRTGRFTRIFPEAEVVDYYTPFFEVERFSNFLLWKWLKSDKKGLYENYANAVEPVKI